MTAQNETAQYYTVSDIRERIGAAVFGVYGSIEPVLREVAHVEQEICSVRYTAVEEAGSRKFAKGFLSCLWVLKNYADGFGADKSVTLPQPPEEFLGEAFRETRDLSDLATALKKNYDSAVSVVAGRQRIERQRNLRRFLGRQ